MKKRSQRSGPITKGAITDQAAVLRKLDELTEEVENLTNLLAVYMLWDGVGQHYVAKALRRSQPTISQRFPGIKARQRLELEDLSKLLKP